MHVKLCLSPMCAGTRPDHLSVILYRTPIFAKFMSIPPVCHNVSATYMLRICPSLLYVIRCLPDICAKYMSRSPRCHTVGRYASIFWVYVHPTTSATHMCQTFVYLIVAGTHLYHYLSIPLVCQTMFASLYVKFPRWYHCLVGPHSLWLSASIAIPVLEAFFMDVSRYTKVCLWSILYGCQLVYQRLLWKHSL